MKKFLISLIIMSFAITPSYAFFWNHKDKALEEELKGKGYAGTLPDIYKKNNKTNKTKVTTPIFESQDNFNDPSDLKPVPQDNPAFINIIQKKDNTSEFTKDVNEVIPMLERLVDCIEEEESLQLYITKSNVLTMNIDHLMEKYEGKPESYFEGFRKLEEVNRYAKTIATLRREAVTYQKYLAYSSTGSIYNPENINKQLEYLTEEIKSAIILLKEQI